MSGIDAVKKIVETEGQARRIVDEATAKAQQIVTRAHEEAEMIRREAVSSAQQKRDEILRLSTEKAEAEARQSDIETGQLLANYQKLATERRDEAVAKAVELILNA